MNRRTFAKSILTGMGAVLGAKLLGLNAEVGQAEKTSVNASYVVNPAKEIMVTSPRVYHLSDAVHIEIGDIIHKLHAGTCIITANDRIV